MLLRPTAPMMVGDMFENHTFLASLWSDDIEIICIIVLTAVETTMGIIT